MGEALVTAERPKTVPTGGDRAAAIAKAIRSSGSTAQDTLLLSAEVGDVGVK